jgi:hypothetical protein
MFRYPKELVGTNHNVTCECSVHAVSHTSSVRTENEIAGETIFTLATGHGSGTQNGAPIALRDSFDILANLNDGAGEFVA